MSDVSPLLTVAMPIYNAGSYLRLAVLSIVQQTFTNWELVIIDDGSTDNALQSIEDINDGRIRIIRDGENKGLAARLNECIDLARGIYLARMDQDDISYPNRFQQQVIAFKSDPKLDLIAVRAITIDENDQIIGLLPYSLTHDEICKRPWQSFYLPHPTWMGKVEWFRKYYYGKPGPYMCEDQELLLRSYDESKFGTIDDVLFAYRVRGKNDYRKLARTRMAVFKVQLQQFVQLKQWYFSMLAIVFFLGKNIYDLLTRINGRSIQPNGNVVSDVVACEWDEVSYDLAMRSESPVQE
jgi:glycosyltransferase involved in cell wall biosynthesis